MLAAVQCNQDCSLTTITVVFRDLHKHWKSFVSKLKCDPPKIENLYVIIFDGLFVFPPPRRPPLFSEEAGAVCVDHPRTQGPLSRTRTLGRSGCGL